MHYDSSANNSKQVIANFLGFYGKYVGQKCTWNGQLHHPTPSNNCLKKWQLRGNFEANLAHLLVIKSGVSTQKSLQKAGIFAIRKQRYLLQNSN
jgi:hypothetical protein